MRKVRKRRPGPGDIQFHVKRGQALAWTLPDQLTITNPMCPKSVLIVEDEPLIRIDAVDTVKDAGFGAYAAPNAARALELLETKSDIGILFTDIAMQGEIDGLQLARIVRERWPHISIIIVSGHTQLAPHQVPEGGAFFSKPYLRSAILKALKGG